jgi:ComF family protein
MRILSKYTEGLSQLFFPLQCAGCGNDAIDKENLFCINCLQQLPETNFTEKQHNLVEKIYYGRIPVEAATAVFFFNKDSLLQHLLHQLKYRGNYKIGVEFGKMIGRRIAATQRFQNIDYVTPIPLSKKRQQQRGYNQAEAIAKGIEEVTPIKLLDNITLRQKHTETQTHKSRQERWENMQHTFFLHNPDQIKGKNILLVDDVITTGATIEACGEALLKATDAKLFVATVAIAMN